MSETKEIVEFTFDKMETYFEAVKQVLEQYGGDVTDLSMDVLRVQAVAELLPNLIGFIGFAGLAYLSYKALFKYGKVDVKPLVLRDKGSHDWDVNQLVLKCTGYEYTKEWKESYEATRYQWKESIGLFAPLSVLMLSGLLAGLNFSGLVNIWAWVGLVYPELYAVHLFLLK